MQIILYYNIFFYYNMSDYQLVESYHETVDSTNIGSRGNYIQTHISNQGIVRIFYTDTSGDSNDGTKDTIMCSIVDRSNTRQVIYNSAYKRTEINDISMNVAKYGENFKTYTYYSSPSNDSVFGEGGTDNSNINKFYIFPMRFKDIMGTQLYNKEGYSTTLGKWWDGYFSGIALNIKNGWYAQLSGNVPDNYRFVNPIQTMTHSLTEPNNWGDYPNMTQTKLIPGSTNVSQRQVDNIIGNFSCAIAPTNQIYNSSEYDKQIVLWLDYDATNYETLGYTLSYYVSTNYVSNALGNAGGYIFKGMKTISSGNSELECMPYSDIDLDISWNVVPPNINNEGTFGRPYFIIRDQQNNKALLGYADLNYSSSSNSNDSSFTAVVGPGNILGAGGYNTKFHKIKCEKKTLENPGSWDNTGIHICFQQPRLPNPSALVYYKYIGPMSGNPLGKEYFYRDPIAGGGNSATGKNPGGFCSMDVWGDNPRIAWYDSSFNSGSIWLAKSDNGGLTWDSSGVMIDDNVGIYQETGNKNYLSLTCDQKNGSVHISYFHNTEGVKYWTNSPNTPQPITEGLSNEAKDINAVDSVRRLNINNTNIVGPVDTGLPKRFDESSIDISWNPVDSSYNAIFSYRHPITDWNEIPNYVTMTDNIVYSKTKTKYYTGDFDKIFVAARVKTNSTIYNGINSLFLIGGQTGSDGSYIGGLSYGALFFGIQNAYLSSSDIRTETVESTSPNPTGDLDSNGNFYLNPNTDYDLEFYYDKIKKYAFIKVNQSGEQEKLFEWNDISSNGGYNMSDGYLTIGNGSHITENNLWCGEKKDGIIKSIMIWNCDIEHVPQYKLYRSDSGGDYVETKSNIKTPYFKDSSGVILDNIPTLNTDYRYKVSSMGNSINVSQNISANETKSEKTSIRQFKDLWNMEYIKNQPLINDITGNIYVTAMDRLDNNIWATMSQDTGSSGNGNDDIYLVYSTDGGQSWQHNTSFSQTTVLNNVKNVMARCLKLYRDPSGGEWCFIGTEGYGIFVSNTYFEDNPSGEGLGTTWKQISDTSETNPPGNPLLGTYLKDSSSLEYNRTITYVHPVDIVKSNSASLYGDSDSTGNGIANNAFHVWIGTESSWTSVIGNIDYSGPGSSWWANSWSSGNSEKQNIRDANLYNFTCVAYSMVVKINGKLYESGLSKIRLRTWTTKQQGSQTYYEPMFQTPDKLGNTDNGFVKPDNFVEWRAYRSPEVIAALNTGPIASGEYEGENEFSKKYKEIGFDVYLGGASNPNPSQGGISPKVTARTNQSNSNTYSALLSVSPWLDSSYNWYYTDSFSDFDVNTSRQKYPTYKTIGGSMGTQDMVIRGNYIDYSNNTLDYSKNIIIPEEFYEIDGKILEDKTVNLTLPIDYRESLGDIYNNNLKFIAYIPEKPDIGLSIVESKETDISYWSYTNPPTYARIGGGNLIGDSKLKADISGNLTNNWMFGHKNSIIKGSNDLLFHKDTSDNWQRIEITDPILDISAGITSIQPLQDSNLLVWVSDVSKNRTGFYKISQKPPMPSLNLIYPADNNDFRARINIENFIVFYSYLSIGHDIKYTWYEKIDNELETSIETDISTYIKVLDLLPEHKYKFRVEAKNKYGVSWSETVELETPEGVPDLTSFHVTNTFINSTLNWKYNVDESGATSITQYDISRSVLNYLTGESYNEILYDVLNGSGLTNIPPIYSYEDMFVDLGSIYTYYVTPYAIDQSGAQVSQVISIGSGVPEFVKGIYYPVENKIIISWVTDKVHVSNNPLANTSVEWDISKVRVDDISDMDTIGGISGEKIYKKTYEITNDFLIPNYNYKFSVRTHYYPNDRRTILPSQWSKPLTFRIEAPIPENIKINYINEQIMLSWEPTSLYNQSVTYSLEYEYNSIVKNIDSINANNIEIKGRSLPGGVDVNFRIKANYINYSSDYSDVISLKIQRHKPININIKSYDNLNHETKKNVTSNKISWEACPGAIDYSLKRYDIYFGNLSPTEPSVTVSNIITNSYIDTNEPLGRIPSLPRRYIYKITANY